jgi:hypothetical protein
MSALPEHEAPSRLQSNLARSMFSRTVMVDLDSVLSRFYVPIKQIAIPVPLCQTDEQLAKSFVQ